MAGWNTPARNAAINKRPCDQKTRWVFGQSRLQLSARVNGPFGSKNGYGGRSTGTSVVLQTADDFGAPRKSAGRCGNIAASFRRRAKMV